MTPPDLRIGDHEREAAAQRLGEHAAAGRLSVPELEQRLERVHAAVFAADLRAVEDDLPSLEPPRPAASRARSWPRPRVAPAALALFVAAVALSVVAGHPVPPLFFAVFWLWRGRFAPRPT